MNDIGRAEVDQRPEEVVPGADEREHRDRRDDRPGERQGDVAEGLERRRAVELGALEDVRRQVPEPLAEQEDGERAAEQVRDDQGQVGADPAEPAEQDELGHDRRRRRDEDRADQDARTGAAGPRRDASRRRSRRGRRNDREDHAQQRDERRCWRTAAASRGGAAPLRGWPGSAGWAAASAARRRTGRPA